MSAVRALLGSFIGTLLANNPGLVSFMGGTVVGVYVEQTYKLPNMEDTAKGCVYACGMLLCAANANGWPDEQHWCHDGQPAANGALQ